MYQAFLLLFWWIFECIKRFCHFLGGFLNVSSVFVTFLVDFRVHQAFFSLFGLIFECIRRFCHFFGGPGTGDRGPETGDRGPDAGDREPGTGDRGPGAGRWDVIN